ncbi:MAG: acyl-CoA dehydrogenase family protein [Candidatus Hydrothermae bacterium]|nr:acyl-CoA dehydrogenase family protein [Candidatus Hydrothermae bacterium]
MDFQLTEEQRMIQEMAREFAQREIAPIAKQIDEEERFPIETVKKMGELGLMGIEIPEAYGGAGADPVAYVLALKEIAKVCASHAVIMSVQNSLVAYGLWRFGTEEQKERFLKPVASGQVIGAYSLTEPQAGSDASNLLTTAVREGDTYILNGRKAWVTNGPHADYIIVFAMTDREKRHKGITAFIVDTSREGITRGRPEKKLGIRAAHSGELILENYRAHVSERLGEEGEGFKIAMQILDAGRIGIAAQAWGIAEAAYEEAARYALEREAFGQKIAQFQAIQFYLAEMNMRLEATRLLTLQAAWLKHRFLQTGEPRRFTREASIAKLFAAESAVWITQKAIQIHGGVGYSREFNVERYYRDAKITEIYEGTSEIQRIVIARQVLQQISSLLGA